jgi:hypothetical protein
MALGGAPHNPTPTLRYEGRGYTLALHPVTESAVHPRYGKPSRTLGRRKWVFQLREDGCDNAFELRDSLPYDAMKVSFDSWKRFVWGERRSRHCVWVNRQVCELRAKSVPAGTWSAGKMGVLRSDPTIPPPTPARDPFAQARRRGVGPARTRAVSGVVLDARLPLAGNQRAMGRAVFFRLRIM